MSDDEGGALEGEDEVLPEDNLGLGEAPFEEEGEASSESDEEGGEEDPLGARAEGLPPADPFLQTANQVARVVELRGEDRHTSDQMGANELAGILSARAGQIDQDGIVFGVEAREGDDAVSLAWRELQARQCPLLVHRLVCERKEGTVLYRFVEVWSANELAQTVALND
jgi:hypothetical protein